MYTHSATFQVRLYLLFIFPKGQRMYGGRGGEGKKAKKTSSPSLVWARRKPGESKVQEHTIWSFYSAAIPGLGSLSPPSICGKAT